MTAFLHDNIEWVIPPVFKSMLRSWACDLIENGTLYLTNIKKFLEDPDPERGDLNEGKTSYIRNGVRCAADYINPIYVWCCTMETQPDRVLSA